METIGDLYANLQRDVGDQGGVFIKIEDAYNWANRGVIEIIRQTELYNKIDYQSTLNAGSSQIGPIPVDIYQIEFVSVNGIELKEVDFTELSRINPSFNLDTDSGQPKYYWANRSSADNTRTLSIYPKTDKQYSYVYRASVFPADFTSTTDKLIDVLPREYHFDLLDFCLYRARLREKDYQGANQTLEDFNSNILLRFSESSSKSSEFSTITPDDLDYSYGAITYDSL